MSGRKRPINTVATSSSKGGGGKKIKIGRAVSIKQDPDRISSGGASNAAISKDDVRKRFINIFSEPRYKTGISSKGVKEKFSSEQEYSLLAEVINDLLRESRLQMSQVGPQKELFYSLVDAEVAHKFQGLDMSARLVMQVIEKAGNQGIWTRDIRIQTNLQQQALNKIFKQLETRRLIKPVKSVTAKAKKLYMLFDLTPSKELTGGVWYSGLEFDHEFISELRTFVMHCVRKLNGGRGVTLQEIRNKMLQAKVSRVELSIEEVTQLVQTLVYDFLVEEATVGDDDQAVFVASRRITTMCEFKWWDALSPDFHFRNIVFEDGVTLGAHEPHHHTA